MIPELGTFAIILAFCFAVIQGLMPVRHSSKGLSEITVIGQFLFLSIAMICLIESFLTNDITVMYVREHSNDLLPFIYRIGAAWGGHEGSLLLWCFILNGWCLMFVLFKNRHLIGDTFLYILQILGIVSAGFIAFLLFTSNPFLRDFPNAPVTGDDLTPVLQDPGLIFHPPMLYLGYVGFAIAFAFAVTALWEGNLNPIWAKALRPWIILPWSFLSGGIVLGSWWAYRELGWGGWWFWDPVENASLLPWLSATALIHSLIVSEKRDSFKGWTLLLAIITFALSLLGTFLVRSGVLVSVHAFASDPTRGVFLLGYLTLIIGGAFLLYSLRIKYFYQVPKFQLLSRETLLLFNTVILITAVATILIGTLYPIILDSLNLGKISIGEPYFNTIFVPIMLPFLFLMGLVPHVNWVHQRLKDLWKKLRYTLLSSFLIALITPWLCGFAFYWLTFYGIFFAVWIILSTMRYALQSWNKTQSFSTSNLAMILAHMGIAILALGITLNKSYSQERQVKMLLGDTVELAGYEFTFNKINENPGPNYQSLTANFTVRNSHTPETFLLAEQRIYSNDQTLSKTGILFNWWRDIYLALGPSLSDGSWSIRIYYKPFVRWIWFGGFLLLLGGFLSFFSDWRKRGQPV